MINVYLLYFRGEKLVEKEYLENVVCPRFFSCISLHDKTSMVSNTWLNEHFGSQFCNQDRQSIVLWNEITQDVLFVCSNT